MLSRLSAIVWENYGYPRIKPQERRIALVQGLSAPLFQRRGARRKDIAPAGVGGSRFIGFIGK
jgi:hypothetical protein